MGCKNTCDLCKNLVLSTAVTYTAPNLVVTVPSDRTYGNCCKVCIVFAQAIPAATTVDAPVVIRIGTGTQLYPLVNCNGIPVTARQVRTRRKYCTRVVTNATSGIFRLFTNLCDSRANVLGALTGTAPAAPAVPEEPTD